MCCIPVGPVKGLVTRRLWSIPAISHMYLHDHVTNIHTARTYTTVSFGKIIELLRDCLFSYCMRCNCHCTNTTKHTLNPKRHSSSPSSLTHTWWLPCHLRDFPEVTELCWERASLHGSMKQIVTVLQWLNKKIESYMQRRAEVQFSDSCWSLPRPEIINLRVEIMRSERNKSNHHVILPRNSKLRTRSSRVWCDTRKRLRMVIHLIPATFSQIKTKKP
jgi:hypothetical protein